MINIGCGWLVPVTLLNIGRGWLVPVTKYRTRGFLGLLDADVVVENTPRTLPRDHVTFGHYGCCASSGCVHSREPRRACAEPTSGLFRSRDFVTSGQKAPLGRIWRNFRLHMRRTYFRTGSLPVTWLASLPVTWLPVAPPHSTPAKANWAVPIYY